MTAKQRVLVVDGLSETEEVLRAVLEPRGLMVDRIRSEVAQRLICGIGVKAGCGVLRRNGSDCKQ